MKANTLSVQATSQPPSITFADSFNAVVHMIDRHIDEGNGSNTAMVGKFGAVTYAELAERVNRAGNAVLDSGLTAGDRVLLVLRDGPEFFYVFWGAVKAGFIPVPLNTLLCASDYQFIIDDSLCEAIIYSQALESEIAEAMGAAAHEPTYVTTYNGFDSAMTQASATLDPALATATSDCFWLYSSGSTGRPKGVVHAHRDIPVTCIHYGVGILGITDQDVFFSAAKLFFAYGLGNAMNFPLWAGGTAVLVPDHPTPDLTFDIIEAYRPTLYFGVPTLYAAQLHAMGPDRDLSSIRGYVSAGEALPADIFQRWEERTGGLILDGIGSTEILHIFISNTPTDHRAGSSGRVVSGYEARVLGADGSDAAPGDTGALWIRGDSVTSGYWNNPERNRQALKDGWIDTGDTYTLDAEGWFTYCGRNDDMMKVGGLWCSPFEIEAALIEHPDVLEAAVVARADADGLIKPEAFIVPTSTEQRKDRLADELRAHCKQSLAPYKYPRWVNFVDELPKTATGKIQRYRLRS